MKLVKNIKLKLKKLQTMVVCSLEPGLSTLLHSSEISWTKKNVVPKKLFKVGDMIDCVITEIDKEKRRIAISHKLTTENPHDIFQKNFLKEVRSRVGSNANEYALYIKLGEFDIDGFLHANDLSYTKNPEEELKNYKKGNKLKVKVLEIKKDEQELELD